MSPKETQTIEWKESWRDEYLRWVCGFANAQGGRLIIGKNDKGVVLGVANAKKLLEDIPNKIRDILEIIVDVNLRVEQGKELLGIDGAIPYWCPAEKKMTKKMTEEIIVLLQTDGGLSIQGRTLGRKGG